MKIYNVHYCLSLTGMKILRSYFTVFI
jgi:hypothetical protein